MFKIEKVVSLPNDTAAMSQDYSSAVSLYSINAGNVIKMTSPTNVGTWEDMLFKEIENAFIEENVVKVSTDYIDDTEVFVLTCEDSMRVLLLPDNTAPYRYDDPYRLYYGVDSNKLYQNIGDNWVFVGTPDHDNLYNTGTMSHKQLEGTIRKLAERITILEGQNK